MNTALAAGETLSHLATYTRMTACVSTPLKTKKKERKRSIFLSPYRLSVGKKAITRVQVFSSFPFLSRSIDTALLPSCHHSMCQVLSNYLPSLLFFCRASISTTSFGQKRDRIKKKSHYAPSHAYTKRERERDSSLIMADTSHHSSSPLGASLSLSSSVLTSIDGQNGCTECCGESF